MANVIDLFCGAGGFSKGFKDLGFNILLGIDNEFHKIYTYSQNIKPIYFIKGKRYISNYANQKDNYRNEEIENANDIGMLTRRVISKKIKGNKVDVIIGSPPCKDFSGSNEHKDISSDRAKLYEEFYRIVRLFKPSWFVMENVLNFFYTKEGELLESDFTMLGYNVKFFTVDSSCYGIPQKRIRGFLIGSLDFNDFDLDSYKNNEVISIRDAISDLEVESNTDELYIYQKGPESEYQHSMRLGAFIVSNHETTDHKTETIEKIRDVRLNKTRKGYYTVRDYDSVSGVITSEFNNPSCKGESIHPALDRTFTAREAARIQSFSDDFNFYGTIDEIALQIGDAVPPLVSRAIARMIKEKSGY